MVAKICLSSEKQATTHALLSEGISHYPKVDQAIAMSSIFVANRLPIQAIIALTESGATAIWMSRQLTDVPIFAVTDNEQTVRKLSLVNNVMPIFFDYTKIKQEDINERVLAYLVKQSFLKHKVNVVITRGRAIGKAGGTNMLEILTV